MKALPHPLEWHALAQGQRGVPTVRGEIVAVGALDRLHVWRGDALVAQAESTLRSPGRPQVCGAVVGWGCGRLDRHSLRFSPTPNLVAAFTHGMVEPVPPSSPGTWLPQACAWSPRGDRMLVSVEWHTPRSGGARALLVAADGTLRAVLREDACASVQAACLGERFAILGSARALVHDADGVLLRRLPNAAPALRLELSADESRLLLTEYGRITLYDTGSWQACAVWTGSWIDAVLMPDASAVFASDAAGRLARLDPAQPAAALEWLATPSPVQAVAIDAQRVVAVFARGDPLAWAGLAA